VAKRVKARMKEENAVLLAAGVAFFGLLAVFPALIALVSVYGLVADPQDVARQVEDLASGLPEETQAFLQDQLDRIVTSSSTGLGIALVVSLAAALWSASSGVRHLMESIDTAYAEPADGFVKLRAKAVVLALGGIVVLALLVGALTVLPALADEISSVVGTIATWARWPIIALVMVAVLAVLYRVAPNRDDAQIRWTSPGGLVATVLWLLTSAALAVYAATFADFQATYGSFGAVIVIMLWLFLSAVSILVGAYVNAEAEHQTEEDTTTGPERPIGERDATMADTTPEAGDDSAEQRREARAGGRR
jgi:membrane protein